MNTNIQKLYTIADKPFRNIIGLMSGTSMDGLDVALCQFEGSGMDTKVKLLNFRTIPYDNQQKEQIRSVFSIKNVELEKLTYLNPWLGVLHAEMILESLQNWDVKTEEVDLIASHGQTIYHAPKSLHKQPNYPNATLQIGDGDHIAVKTNIITISDFRQKHLAAGGEGAPLAVYGDYLLFSKKGKDRILLNIGGIANYTYLPADLNADRVFATDTGSGNTLLDAFVQKYYNLPYDEDAKVALKGKINEDLLTRLKNHPFFKEPVPKSTGPELFNLSYLEKSLEDLSKIDLCDQLATLCKFSADTISENLFEQVNKIDEIYISGGGAHNPLMVELLKKNLPTTSFEYSDSLGISADAKEAVLFATLANESVAGGEVNFGSKTRTPSVSMGKVSFPL